MSGGRCGQRGGRGGVGRIENCENFSLNLNEKGRTGHIGIWDSGVKRSFRQMFMSCWAVV